MMVDCLLNFTPDGKYNRVQIRAIRCTQWTAGSQVASSVFLAVWEGAPFCCSDY